ncbi:MAG: glycosyltransferase [Chthoniobacterales bacterium]
MSDLSSEYAFRFDAPIAPRFFGDELPISGWLIHRGGQPIQGIRAVVKRSFAREQIFRGRRKRSRPDVEAAFPDLPEAKASGFLIELRLSLGVNQLRLQLLDHTRVWRTFHSAAVTAFPLSLLARAGFSRVRQLVLSSLSRRYAEKGRLPTVEIEGSTSRLPAIERVELFATSRSNLFILEIGEVIAAGFRELGCAAQVHLDQPPVENPPDDLLQIVVTPHEFYGLYLTREFSRERAQELSQQTVLLCTEQPETGWFQSNLQWARYARGVADINPLGVLAYRARAVPCRHLALGYHPLLGQTPRETRSVRPTEITFLGSLTERREKFFAEHADFFARRRCHLRFVPLHFAKTEATRSYLSAERRNALLAASKILLNVHYSEQRYFEWHRMLVALANGCCIISEICQGHGPLVPGKHFIMVEPENLIIACEYYLKHPEECEKIARQGFEFVEKELRQSQMCAAFLRDFETGDGAVPADAAAKPLPSELLGQFSGQWRRALRQAAAADFRDLVRRPVVRAEAPAPVTERSDTIERREKVRARFREQEERRAAEEHVWTLTDNAAYERVVAPQISVVITLFNYAQFVGDCIGSVEEAAKELLIEIVLIDDASTDDSLVQARICQERSPLPMRIVAKRFNTGLADARNVGTRLARAPFVFMMDADNLVFPAALSELLTAVSEGDCAAAYSLLCRFRGTPDNRVGLLSAYDWDPQILVQHPYVDAMALFRRDVLLDLGGYDNDLNQIGWFGWEDYDLWLRFALRNLRVGFVPNILCLYRQHETSMLSVTNLFELDLVRHFKERFGELSERFEPQAKLFGVEREKIAGGKPCFFIASGCPIATTTLYRCVNLREQLEVLGYEARVAHWFAEAEIAPDDALAYDVIVLYRLAMCPPLQDLIERARSLGKTILFDIDDLVFEPELTQWHRGVAKLSSGDQKLHQAGVERYLATLLACDVTMTATPLLAEFVAKRGKPSFVHRNALGKEMSAHAEKLYRSRKQGDRLVLGYGSGTPTHDVDFEEAVPALARILDRYPEVELWIAGPLVLPRALARAQRFPLMDWRGWFELLSRMDVALAPLERDNIFCRAKSEIKFVESGALGVPLVASRIDPFVQTIREGENGFLAATAQEWEEALQQLIEQPELRRQIGEAARRTVLEQYSPEVRSRQLAAFLPAIAR